MAKDQFLNVRVTHNQKAGLVRLARSYASTPSKFTSDIVSWVLAAKNGTEPDPTSTLATVADALGLPKDSTPQQVLDALKAVADEIGNPQSDPTASAPDAPAPPFGAQLSADDRARAAAITDPEQRERFIQLRKDRAAHRAALGTRRGPRKVGI